MKTRRFKALNGVEGNYSIVEKIAIYDDNGNKKVVYNDSVELSGNVGDIKCTVKEDKVQSKFGKTRPIQEYPVQDKKWIIKYH